MEMASAYGTLAASGIRVEPTLVDRITNTENRTLFDHRPSVRQVVSPTKALKVVPIMRQVVNRGAGRRVRAMGFDRPVAGKTGTTNDNTDAWFSGFTPELVASVWVGFDDRKRHRLVDQNGVQITGSSGAAPIWTTFMHQAVAEAPPAEFSMPAGMSQQEIEPTTGLAARILPDSLNLTHRPVRLALVDTVRANTWEDVRRFEEQSGRPLIDSVLERARPVLLTP